MVSKAREAREALEAWEQSRPRNYFASDAYFRKVLEVYLDGSYSGSDLELNRVGELAAGKMNELSILSNREENLPTLRCRDGFGNRAEEVMFHPSYHELGSLVWGTGVLSRLAEPGNSMISGAMAYLVAHNGEAGHLCPVACTAGAIQLIQKLGSDEQKKVLLPRLLDRDYQKRIHASQFLTEVQSGSDVGANACEAVPAADRPGWYRITGEKWFCSVADAGLFVVTARPRDSAGGTKGLALFLVPRYVDGSLNQFAIRRLKTKLGTRSMATGEIDFDGALAEAIGSLTDGFKNVVRFVLDTSRLYNAIAACGMMRRAFLEAQTFARHRRSFGRPILEYPLVQKTLASMRVQASASVASTFRILRWTDLDQTGHDEERAAARRISVMLNKYWTSSRCTEVVRNGIEILGGNGTIEDFSVLPRLYRDAMVIESWEGTHNVLCLQVFRDFAQRAMHRSWLRQMRKDIEGIAAPFADHRKRANAFLDDIEKQIERVLSEGQESALIRTLADRMCILLDYTSLLQVESLHPSSATHIDCARYHRLWRVDSADPLQETEFAALESRLAQSI